MPLAEVADGSKVRWIQHHSLNTTALVGTPDDIANFVTGVDLDFAAVDGCLCFWGGERPSILMNI